MLDKTIQHIISCYEKTKKDYNIYTIEGSLIDNYIIEGENLKTCIIKETYLNEWSSDYKIRFYKKTPKKYKKIIELLENLENEKAMKLFYN